MSDYHPETWNPSWSVASILTGLQSFFYENTATTGSVKCSARERQKLAAASAAFNEKNPSFRKVFPDLIGTGERSVSELRDRDRTTGDVTDGARRGETTTTTETKKNVFLARFVVVALVAVAAIVFAAVTRATQ
jgi:ubiquitin-conjugating enzyme E2 J2